MSSKQKSRQNFGDIETFSEDDITASEDDLSESERELLKSVREKRAPENFDSDDEVLGLHNDAESNDSMESDIERAQDDEDLPDERAWGRKKKDYYSADYVDPDYSTTSHKGMKAAELEEQEARKIQQRLAEQLDDADFGLDLLPGPTEADADASDMQIVKKDLSLMNKREKRALFHKENPEFQPLVQDAADRLAESKDILMPFIHLVKEQNVPDCPAVNFLKIKYNVTLNYCVNISYYLMLKAKRISTSSHPVMKRLAQYRQLLNNLEKSQGDILERVSKILEAHNANEPIYPCIVDGLKL